MPKHLFSSNGVDGGMKTFVHTDVENEGKLTFVEETDPDPLIKAAKILSDEPPSAEMRHVAFIPKTVLNQAIREGWVHDDKAWKRWANDPDNAYLRTWPGRI